MGTPRAEGRARTEVPGREVQAGDLLPWAPADLPPTERHRGALGVEGSSEII